MVPDEFWLKNECYLMNSEGIMNWPGKKKNTPPVLNKAELIYARLFFLASDVGFSCVALMNEVKLNEAQINKT